jgi:hypothetical protein
VQPSERAANRLFLAFKDFQDAKRYLQAERDLSQLQKSRGTSEYFDHCEAITVAAIVAYCRSFKASQTQGNADRQLDPKALALFSNRPDLETLHDRLIERRDKAVAHGDWEYHATEVISRNYKQGILRRSPSPNMTGGIPLNEFAELVEYVSARCLHRAIDLDREGPARAEP